MKIPSSLNEGKVCFITANSWGVGWGKGGHACLSEKWVKNFRFNIPFLAVEKVI
jgi:C1A family cysteine protease